METPSFSDPAVQASNAPSMPVARDLPACGFISFPKTGWGNLLVSFKGFEGLYWGVVLRVLGCGGLLRKGVWF